MVKTTAISHLYISILIFFCCIVTNKPAMSYEEPTYKVVKKTSIYEVRLYAKRTVAQVVYGKEDSGFRVLFDYISGGNKTSKEVQMTVPVTQSETIDMTVPVTRSNQDDRMIMQFFLPKQYSSKNAPTPDDNRIDIVDLPEAYYAVISYSGSASDKNFKKHFDELKVALNRDNLKISGMPIKATYNSPFTLPFLRRNEAMFPLDWN